MQKKQSGIDKLIDIEKLRPQLLDALSSLNLEKIILFGSYAYGVPNEDSDLDLYVVTKDDFMPKTWKEKSEVHLTVTRKMRALLQKYPTDLITHTKAMHDRFVEQDSLFCKKILNDGIVIL